MGIMAQFPKEIPDNPKTSGNGNFLHLNHEEYNHFYDSSTLRCDGGVRNSRQAATDGHKFGEEGRVDLHG